MTEGPIVLVVDDEVPIRRFLAAALTANGLRCAEAADLEAARVQVTARMPDVVVLDLGLPDGDGLALIRELRGWSSVPIVVVSARGRESDKVEALDAGADDYLTKPFGVPELLARIRVALRHAARTPAAETAVDLEDVDGGVVRVDLAARRVTRLPAGAGVDGDGGVEIHLTATEFRLLAILCRHLDRVCTHVFLLRECWGAGHEGDLAYLRVFMGQLRHKLEPQPSRPRWLLTELGVGYRLRQQAAT